MMYDDEGICVIMTCGFIGYPANFNPYNTIIIPYKNNTTKITITTTHNMCLIYPAVLIIMC